MSNNTTSQVATNPAVIGNTSQNYGVFDIAVGVSVIVFPIILVLSINAYRKYRIAARREKITYLEKVWRLNSAKKNV
ncbi:MULTISPECIES: hypothetical protein [unclassified Tolypothrix]|uniref:hypothetical protein n=1 Tax=unclassified Tolypothrix TaxID=2649714 RepID=UPI0005EAC199|nr:MULTISPECIES: hypothetical protein [unclassified Tolypothrix]BAY92123.1 hypothetical protein NIES3275_41550 [Microchaete diplosiphon NIES-3275]EKF04659.1 hypothetical protein FDUTEX481_00816 [Tolypothrix sp. PCC 7601]MBE9084380.1 hypothetical protein [Tolypothrix sp. LEGE 11397]UYD26105.1 hypothetical protein HGR01_33175 [Tolypothrix sp. PCC 7712]UYD31657.1 hypothetical protein HG267_21350 [Tolypothrix sp. PCC 7601]